MHSNAVITFTDADTATMAEIVSDLESSRRALAAAEAAQTRALARAGRLAQKQAAGSPQRVRDHDMALRAIAAEAAGVLGASDRTVQRRIGIARELVEDYPATLDAWGRGIVTRAHVMVIMDAGVILPPELRGAFEQQALERCDGETPWRVKGELEILANRMHPRSLTERHQAARDTRSVGRLSLGEGISELRVVHDTVIVEAIYDRLTQQARSIVDARGAATDALRGSGAKGAEGAEGAGGSAAIDPAIVASDTRTMDQIRADVVADMLLTASPAADPTATEDGPGVLGAIRAKVQVIVPVRTLMGREDGPADLVGSSPIDAETARILAGMAREWSRLLTDPLNGQIQGVDRYRIPPELRSRLAGRDQHCRFPGCRMPAVACEVDHTIDYALGGLTVCTNLAHLCQRHHSMKQFTAWTVRQLEGGVLEWTSPLGRIYIDRPDDASVHFVDNDDGPPGAPPPF